MSNNPNKAGRKPKHFIARNGDQIRGLARDAKSGRWRIIATGQTFREDDEANAIERFQRMTADASWPEELGDKPTREGSAVGEIVNGFALVGGVVGGLTAEQRFWRYVARQIQQRPKWVAEQTGVEELGYLRKIKPPPPVPKLTELESIWRDNFTKSAEQRRKVLLAWKDFVATTKVAGIEDITPEIAIAYRDAVYGRKLSGKSQMNLFTRIRRLISFARDRAVAMELLNRALEYLALLKPSGTTVSLDPKPLEPRDFMTLVDEAKGDDKAVSVLPLTARRRR